MSILGTIMSSILGGRAQPAPLPAGMMSPDHRGAPANEQPPKRAPEQPRSAAQPVAAHVPPEPRPEPTPGSEPHPTVHAESAAPKQHQVDVAAVLDKHVEEAGQELNWRTSIVDLMKLLKLDSSLAARKALAKELNYTGDTTDSATMNVWLHKQVMAKLEQGGGKLPADVKH